LATWMNAKSKLARIPAGACTAKTCNRITGADFIWMLVFPLAALFDGA